jgi:acetolactate synthase I/II/III large subunit
MSEKLSGARIMCRALVDAGVEVLFGYPGGAIMPFYHALPEYPALRHILVRHEQAAAHAADGYARASGRVGVCVATSGPGATNLVTGLATASMDSSPVVAITGQVARTMMGKDAFQETDIVGITLPITKHSYLVEDASELAEVMTEAIAIATEGRPGPVLIDVPKDVQNQEAEYTRNSSRSPGRPAVSTAGVNLPPLDDAIRQATALIDASERPLLMVGHGVILANAYPELKAFAEKTGTPVITTLLGISAFPDGHPLHLGMPGMHGEVHVNRAIQAADLVIGVGLRFDDRVTGNTATFASKAKIIHIDLDPTEIGRTVRCALGIEGDAKKVLGCLATAVAQREHGKWQEEIRALVRHQKTPYQDLSPESILAAIQEATGGVCTIVTDVGQHQMWIAKLFPYRRPNTHITSGGLGSMGFAVPAAMGVHMARPNEPVWSLSGDGGFQMNLPEIATMVQEGLPVKLGIFNNGYLGMVRQWQQFFHGRRYSCTPIWSPDYVKLAEAYGIPAWRVRHSNQLAEAVAGANAAPGPALVEFVIEQEANVFPMIRPGGSLSEPIEAEPAQAGD